MAAGRAGAGVASADKGRALSIARVREDALTVQGCGEVGIGGHATGAQFVAKPNECCGLGENVRGALRIWITLPQP